jgi:hypothetical protein
MNKTRTMLKIQPAQFQIALLHKTGLTTVKLQGGLEQVNQGVHPFALSGQKVSVQRFNQIIIRANMLQ